MTKLIKTFAADESGAVTVDFVVLCAAAAALAVAVGATIANQVNNSAGALGGIIDAEVTAASGISGTVTGVAAIVD